MAPRFRWRDPEGVRNITQIVKNMIPQWKDGLYPWQLKLVVRILDGGDIFCCIATGGGKSALLGVPIIVLKEVARRPDLYPDLSARLLPVGLVITPTKGLAANIVLELKKLNVPAFAYFHETVTEACITGHNLVHEIRDCKTWNTICVDPEHLHFEHEFGLSPVSSFGGGRKRSSSDHPSIWSAATSELDMFSIAPQPPSPPILMSLPPSPRRTKSRTSSLSRSQSELVTTLSPPPRRTLRPKISVEGRMHRQSIMRKPPFLDIDDEYDKELDPPPHPKSMPRQASFLDLTRDSFDSSRSVDLDSLDYN